MSGQVRVVLRHNTVGAKAGDRWTVDQETADHLIANGHARLAPRQPKVDSEDEQQPAKKSVAKKS